MRLFSRPFLAAGRRALFALVAGLGLAGCPIESDRPLEPVGVDDPRLQGTWLAVTEDGRAFFHIFRASEAPAGSIELALVAFEADGTGENSRYAGHLSEVNGERFASMQGPFPGATPEGPYTLVNYRFAADGALELRLLSEAAVHDAIAAGRLAAEPDSDGTPGDRITDSPARIRAFLATADPATLYEKPLRLTPVGPQP